MTTWRLYPGLPFLALLVVAALAHPDTGYSCNPPETFEEKLDRMVEYDDSDGDGVVSAKDIDRSFILYDHNHKPRLTIGVDMGYDLTISGSRLATPGTTKLDGVVSPYEFVKEWTCRYGDQPDVAHRIFNQLTQGFSLLLFEPSRNSANETVVEFRESLYSFYTENEIRGT